jgi:hypothetical protein
VRVDRAVRIGEAELRYQLDRKDDHPLARSEELLDVLAELSSTAWWRPSCAFASGMSTGRFLSVTGP